MASGHVWITPCGHGKRVVPANGPYECRLADDGSLVVSVGSRERRIGPGEPPAGALTAECEVADVVAGPDYAGWWLDARVYRVPVPAHWTMVGPAETPECWFVRPGGLLVSLQTAKQVPPTEELAAPGQTVTATGTEGATRWVELAYEHGGQDWAQRHVVMPAASASNLVISAQGPTRGFAEPRELQRWLAERLVVMT